MSEEYKGSWDKILSHTVNGFIARLVAGWCVVNWEALIILFGKYKTPEAKIASFKLHIKTSFESHEGMLWILFLLVIVFVYPFFTSFFSTILTILSGWGGVRARKWLKNKQSQIDYELDYDELIEERKYLQNLIESEGNFLDKFKMEVREILTNMSRHLQNAEKNYNKETHFQSLKEVKNNLTSKLDELTINKNTIKNDYTELHKKQ